MNRQTKLVKSFIVGAMGIVSIVYIINPTAGIIELIPDNLPFIGNIDEAGAVGVLYSCLRYFGIDVYDLLPLGNVASQDTAAKEKVDNEKSP